MKGELRMITDKTKQAFQDFFKNRIKNYTLWISVIALITNLAINGYIELPANFESVATAILNLLMVLGILNNPSTESQNIFIDVDGDGIDDRYDDDIDTNDGAVG